MIINSGDCIRGYFNGFMEIWNVNMIYDNGNTFEGSLIKMKAEG